MLLGIRSRFTLLINMCERLMLVIQSNLTFLFCYIHTHRHMNTQS